MIQDTHTLIVIVKVVASALFCIGKYVNTNSCQQRRSIPDVISNGLFRQSKLSVHIVYMTPNTVGFWVESSSQINAQQQISSNYVTTILLLGPCYQYLYYPFYSTTETSLACGEHIQQCFTSLLQSPKDIYFLYSITIENVQLQLHLAHF